MNSTGLKLSPCGVPVVEAKARQSPVDRLGSSDVAARRKPIMRNSGSSRIDCNTSRSLSRRMVSKA